MDELPNVPDLEIPDFRIMKLYVREEVFASIVSNKLPWEDFSIGFQMRITRIPNSYESDFWFHFTNVYIDPVHFISLKLKIKKLN